MTETPARTRERPGEVDRRLLCLFPWFGADATGGVQLSGRLAWEGLRARLEAENGALHTFSYAPGRACRKTPQPTDATVAHSRLDAVRKALGRGWACDDVLVWHDDLLKLVPLLGAGRARVTLFLHGVEVWRQAGRLERFLMRNVDLFLSNTQHTWERFLAFHPWLADKPQRTVHLGVGVPAGDATRPADRPAALMVSRLARGEDYKGHREMIGAWPLVLEQMPAAQLWIAGEGDLRPELERMVRERGLAEQVRFHGWVTEEEKQALIEAAHCLALPSRGEGFGLVYLEAMRLGRPCLVSTLDAGREVVNPPEAGLAADPGDAQALAGAVCRLLAPGAAWERWSRQARARYENHFTARHYQERLVAALFGGESEGAG